MKNDQIPIIWQAPVYLPYLQPALTDLGFGNEWTQHAALRHRPLLPNIQGMDWTEYEGYGTIALDGLLPLNDDGHWFICLDYLDDKNYPKVTYIDTELDTEELIAESFDEYLNQLTLEWANLYALQTDHALDEIVRDLQKMLPREGTEILIRK